VFIVFIVDTVGAFGRKRLGPFRQRYSARSDTTGSTRDARQAGT
jgi:hypothetical protein